MSQYEITVDKYLDVVGGTNPSINFLSVVNGPVNSVSWFQSLVFCNKLSTRELLTPVYTINGSTNPDDWGAVPTANTDPTFAAWNAVIADWNANGYRLPTEMEFEWAMMGATSDRSNGYTGVGTNTTGYQKGYAGSTEAGTAYVNLGNYAWYTANAGSTTHTIGTKLPNELGFYDLSGNVREFCWDWYGTVGAGELDNYHGGPAATDRVIKGGDWQNTYLPCEVDRRAYIYPYSAINEYGFRVVRN
jgi:formylglycine-generating enzyme required for sulfatase activity